MSWHVGGGSAGTDRGGRGTGEGGRGGGAVRGQEQENEEGVGGAVDEGPGRWEGVGRGSGGEEGRGKVALEDVLLRAWGGKRSGLLELVEVMDLTIVFPDCICIS
jgi:hypothetical protein